MWLYRLVNYENNPPTETHKAYVNAAHIIVMSDGFYSFGNYATGVTRQIQVDTDGTIIYDIH